MQNLAFGGGQWQHKRKNLQQNLPPNTWTAVRHNWCEPKRGECLGDLDNTFYSLITHTLRWTAQGMGYQGVCILRSEPKYHLKNHQRIQKYIYRVCIYIIKKHGFPCLAIPRVIHVNAALLLWKNVNWWKWMLVWKIEVKSSGKVSQNSLSIFHAPALKFQNADEGKVLPPCWSTPRTGNSDCAMSSPSVMAMFSRATIASVHTKM
jgi:hypothetical protein